MLIDLLVIGDLELILVTKDLLLKRFFYEEGNDSVKFIYLNTSELFIRLEFLKVQGCFLQESILVYMIYSSDELDRISSLEITL